MSSAVQRQMDLRDPRYRPTTDTNAAMALLDLSADEVLALVDSGDLAGFNIAVDANGRRELRILASSIAHYHNTLGSRPVALDFEKVVKAILPHNKPVISGVELQRMLNCDSGHVINLLLARELEAVKGTSWGAGRGNTASVTRASVIEFLRRRLL
jgi:hypothetical protein